MDALGLRRAVIVGHSMGSLVALRFAIDRPDRTAGLVLLGAFPTIKGHPEVQAFWDTALARLTDPVDPALARAFQESTIATPIAPAQLDLFVAESLRVPARVWRETFREFLAADFSAEISRIGGAGADRRRRTRHVQPAAGARRAGGGVCGRRPSSTIPTPGTRCTGRSPPASAPTSVASWRGSSTVTPVDSSGARS